MMACITATGSRPSAAGHLAHRGRPARSREETGRVFPHAAHGSVCFSPQAGQYQSWPRRWKDRSCLPHCAQHGGEITAAPAARSATSRSATARGAGDLPSASTAGRSARAEARRRALARPPVTAVTTARICSGDSRGSAAATKSVISPTGSDTTRRPLTLAPDRECGPAWDADRRCRPRRRPLSSSGCLPPRPARPARSGRSSSSPGCPATP